MRSNKLIVRRQRSNRNVKSRSQKKKVRSKLRNKTNRNIRRRTRRRTRHTLRKKLKGGSSESEDQMSWRCGVSSEQMDEYLQRLKLEELIRHTGFDNGQLSIAHISCDPKKGLIKQLLQEYNKDPWSPMATYLKNARALSIKGPEQRDIEAANMKARKEKKYNKGLSCIEKGPCTLEFYKEYVPSQEELMEHKNLSFPKEYVPSLTLCNTEHVQNLLDRKLKSQECKEQSLKSARSTE